LGSYLFANTQFKKKSEDSMGVWSPSLNPVWVRQPALALMRPVIKKSAIQY